jgi:hypothetical protein
LVCKGGGERVDFVLSEFPGLNPHNRIAIVAPKQEFLE